MDLTDSQWSLVDPLIPLPRRRPGRPWIDRRAVLDGILWVQRTGSPWRDLPRRYPSYQTCHRRYRAWCRAGVMSAVLQALFRDLRDRGGLDLSDRAVLAALLSSAWADPEYTPSSVGLRPDSWQWSTALIFLVPILLRLRRAPTRPGDL